MTTIIRPKSGAGSKTSISRYSRPSSKGKSKGLETGSLALTSKEKAVIAKKLQEGRAEAKVNVTAAGITKVTAAPVKSTVDKIKSSFRDPRGAYVTSKSFYEYGGEGVQPGKGAKISKIYDPETGQVKQSILMGGGVRKITYNYETPTQQENRVARNRRDARKKAREEYIAKERASYAQNIFSKQQASKVLRDKPLSPSAYAVPSKSQAQSIMESPLVTQPSILRLQPDSYVSQSPYRITKEATYIPSAYTTRRINAERESAKNYFNRSYYERAAKLTSAFPYLTPKPGESALTQQFKGYAAGFMTGSPSSFFLASGTLGVGGTVGLGVSSAPLLTGFF